MIRNYKKSWPLHTILGGLLVLAVVGFGLTKAQTQSPSQNPPRKQGEKDKNLKEPGMERSAIPGQTVESPQLGLFQTEENGQNIWMIRGRILLPDGEPARNLNVSYGYDGNYYHKVNVDDDGYFTEKRGIRDRGESLDDTFLMTGVSPITVAETEPCQWALPPTLLKDARQQPPDKFVFRFQKGCPLIIDVRFAGESPRFGSVAVDFPTKDEDNRLQAFKLNIYKNKAEYYCCALPPGDYHVYWDDTPWTTTTLAITEDDVIKGIPKRITLDVPAPSIIDLGKDNEEYGHLSTVRETQLERMDENGNYRGGSFLYSATSERNTEGRFLAWLSPGLNIITAYDDAKGGALCVAESETAGKVYLLEVKPKATGKVRLIDKTTGKPLAGVCVNYEPSFNYRGKRQRFGFQEETTTNTEGVAEFKGMIPNVEYRIVNFFRHIEHSFVASNPGELNDFGEVKLDAEKWE